MGLFLVQSLFCFEIIFQREGRKGREYKFQIKIQRTFDPRNTFSPIAGKIIPWQKLESDLTL